MAFQPGEEIDGRYTILEELGRGGMATVYRASQPAVNRLVAIKVLPTNLAGDPAFFQRFEREARLIAALEHPHIVPVYDFGSHRGQAYLVMRYIEGGTLFEELQNAPLRPDRALNLLTQVADALDYAHRNGIVHRDIKPSNIFLDQSGNAYVADFGIAKALEVTSSLTGSGIIGTPEYMAPEQATGRPVDGRTDVYSLGVMLFQMVTGRLPFSTKRGDALSLAYKHVAELPPSPRLINPGLLPAMDGVILKALAKDPSLRYPTAGNLAQALRGVVEADSLRRAAEGIRQLVEAPPAPEPTASFGEKLVSVALAGGAAGGVMFLAGLLIALAGAFTRASSAGATVTIEDIGTPLVSALVVGLVTAGLRMMRVFLPRSGCLGTGLHAGFGLAIGLAAAFAGYAAFLIVTPGNRAGAGIVGIIGSLLAVFELFGLSAVAAGFGAGLAGPISRKRPLWKNGLAVIVPLALGVIAASPAAYESVAGSANLYDLLRLAVFFLAQPVILVGGLVVAELSWRYG